VYRVETDSNAMEQIAALPDDAPAAYAQVFGVLELVPWNGDPPHEDNPDVLYAPCRSAGPGWSPT
jgi:hypothetical protein